MEKASQVTHAHCLECSFFEKMPSKNNKEIKVENTVSNRRLAHGLIEAMNKRNHADLEKRLSENAALDFPGAGRIEGRKRILSFIKALFRKFPRLEFSINDIIVDGDRACVIWTNEGERKDGKPYSNKGITLVQISDEKIDFISDYFKDTSFVS